MENKPRGLEKEVWIIVRAGEIVDAVLTNEEVADFLALDGDEVIPYTIKI
jgi:6-phosphogluconate dehydrogenase (decarboxylating)